MMTLRASQQGATLLVTLVMLMVITLFVVSMINTNTVTTKVVGNMQTDKVMEVAAQQAIEKFISTSANFTPPPTTTTSVTVVTPYADTASSNQKTVTVNVPRCVGETVASGYSLGMALAPKDTLWEVTATATDTASGSSVQVVEGVKMRLPSGNCP